VPLANTTTPSLPWPSLKAGLVKVLAAQALSSNAGKFIRHLHSSQRIIQKKEKKFMALGGNA